MRNKLKYPNGAEFAFTILDDTDDTTVSNGKPVYDLLRDNNLRTTKTVWAFDALPKNRGPYFAGETLSSQKYLEWVHKLEKSGFEIAFHNATMGSSFRQDTIRALDFIEAEFGQPVRLHCNHGQNRENLHWGADRYHSFIIKKTLNLISKYRSSPLFEGNNPESPYYWSDVADQRLSYIRAFTFRQLNGMLIPPGRPYKDPVKQSGPLFFNTADAPDIKSFNKIVNPRSIENLRKQKGWAIISTHLGKGFISGKKIDPDFSSTIKYLASLPGWFVPVSQLLDFIKSETGGSSLTTFQRSRMEFAHVLDRISAKFL